MKTKHFIITVPMLAEGGLKKINYSSSDLTELPTVKSRFPGIPLIEWNLALEDENIQISVLITDDDNHRSQKNLELLKEELQELSSRIGKPLTIKDLIHLPHNETKEKQVETFKKLKSIYKENTELFVDVTYGTKATPICTFASLVYAEKVKESEISSIIYGKYSHDESEKGIIYDIRSLYEINMLIHTATNLPNSDVDQMIDLIWG